MKITWVLLFHFILFGFFTNATPTRIKHREALAGRESNSSELKLNIDPLSLLPDSDHKGFYLKRWVFFQGLLATLLMVLDTCHLDMSQGAIKNPSKSNPLGLTAKSSFENL